MREINLSFLVKKSEAIRNSMDLLEHGLTLFKSIGAF